MEEKETIMSKVIAYTRRNWKKFLSGALMIAGLAVGADIVMHRDNSEEDVPVETTETESE